MRSRSAVCGLAYAKMLHLPVSGPDSVTVGSLANMFGTDADNLLSFWVGLLGLFLEPIEILGIVAMLSWFVGM